MNKLVFVFTLGLFIQTTGYAKSLTLQESLNLALQNNNALKASRMETIAEDEAAKAAESRELPLFKLNGNVGGRRSDIFTISQNSLTNGIPASDTQVSANNGFFSNLNFIVQQPIYSQQIFHASDKAKFLSDEARYREDREKRSVIFKVKHSFYEAFQNQMEENALRKIAEAKNERLRVTRAQKEQGSATSEDVLMAETDLADSQLAADQQGVKKDLTLSRLMNLIGSTEQISLTASPQSYTVLGSLEGARDAALRHREELNLFTSMEKATQEDIALARGQSSPDVSLVGRYTFQNKTGVTLPQTWQVGAQVDWVPFDWNEVGARVRSQEAFLQKVRYQHREEENAVSLEAEEAWRLAKVREEEVGVREKAVQTAEYSLQRMFDKVKEGTLQTADLLEGWSRFIKSYSTFVGALSQLNVAVARLELATSVPANEWTKERESYKPDLDSLSKRLQQLITKKKES